ncbi:MAG: polyphosphate kinase 1 [Chitinophagales bacterium]|nr:polyphosphate kinase 1 [Chitinophagaceae bacterium]MBP9884428.1 polyphosphate kinase 1 [Chitinophagales bacterium]
MQYINREISWLSFNERVLQEAQDTSVPLMERLRFLGIFSSNLDEFFRVRVASLKRMTALRKKAIKTIGESPKKVMAEILDRVITMQNRFNLIYQHIVHELEQENIFILNESQLTPEQGAFVRNYFHQEVRAVLVPIMVDAIEEFPYLKDHAIYLAVLLSDSTGKHKSKYSVIEVPTDRLSRFLVLPKNGDRNFVVLLDDVIRYCLDDVFYIFPHDTYKAATIKLTRDAELDLLEDFNQSVTEKIEKGIKQRKRGKPVRFIYDAAIDSDMLDYILKRMHLKKGNDHLVAGARYHNFKDFQKFPSLGKIHLLYPRINHLHHPDIEPNKSILQVIKRKDILLHFPYHSFDSFIDFLRESAIDPKVTEIKITLYRLAKNSRVANALINAVRNGKKVLVVMELQARFDEEHNILWSDQLGEEGAQVIFGIQGLKVHSKVCLISRREKGEIVQYANISTGNYNESTAEVYADHSLFTTDKRITDELQLMFEFFQNSYRLPDYKHLVMSPTYMRKKLEKLINREIEFAQDGKPARIDIKLNNVADLAMVAKVVEAAKAGVKVRMLVRGTCSLYAISEELKSKIEIISIVDRFLEHSRILIFNNGGDEIVYLTSADWMVRNLNSRVEMACPVYDAEIRNELKDYFNLQFKDNVKARVVDANQFNQYKKDQQLPCRSQQEIYNYLKEKVLAAKLRPAT